MKTYCGVNMNIYLNGIHMSIDLFIHSIIQIIERTPNTPDGISIRPFIDPFINADDGVGERSFFLLSSGNSWPCILIVLIKNSCFVRMKTALSLSGVDIFDHISISFNRGKTHLASLIPLSSLFLYLFNSFCSLLLKLKLYARCTPSRK